MPQNKNRLLWVIPLGCLGVIVISFGGCLMLIGGGGWFLYRAATNHPAYRDSVERIKNDPRVIEALGEPVSIGWGGSYHAHSDNNQGTASFTFPVLGPKASGKAEVDAVTNDGKWTLNKLDVNTEDKTISLLPKPAIHVAPKQAVDPGEAVTEEESPVVVNEAATAETPSDEPQ